MSALEEIKRLRANVGTQVIGQEEMVERLIIGLLANGNLLVEGLPGLAKTRAVKSLATHLEADLSRIQFTPDLLPGDVTGTEIYHSTDGGGGEFRYQPGPIFANLVLADEVNRAPAKVQAALLEAMEERQVTVAGKTHRLPDLFMVMATQNPIEQEGTYPLPEAQMDRFMMHVEVRYPDEAAEAQVIELVRGETAAGEKPEPPLPVAQSVIFEARAEIDRVQTSEAILQYIVDLVFATRYPERYGDPLAGWISLGASPRAGIHLDKGSRTHAWLDGRDYTTPEDVRAVLHGVLRHRVSLSYEASAEGLNANRVIDEIAKLVAVP
ncbi:MAG: MoxR family ATPase [Myxococcota bacterium]|nr:MoxR family ATPase [Myxococcota bacterium]